jgi:hypothetical protein
VILNSTDLGTGLLEINTVEGTYQLQNSSCGSAHYQGCRKYSNWTKKTNRGLFFGRLGTNICNPLKARTGEFNRIDTKRKYMKPIPKPVFVNLLSCPGIYSQPGGIDSWAQMFTITGSSRSNYCLESSYNFIRNHLILRYLVHSVAVTLGSR